MTDELTIPWGIEKRADVRKNDLCASTSQSLRQTYVRNRLGAVIRLLRTDGR